MHPLAIMTLVARDISCDRTRNAPVDKIQVVEAMDGSSSFNRQYEALYREVLYMDAQANSSSGVASTQLAEKKMRTLDEMVRLCALHGQSEYQRLCERARTLHVGKLADVVNSDIVAAVTRSTTNSRRTASCVGAGNDSSRVADVDVGAKMKKECSGRNRLANVEAETLDQVNDKKVAEKYSQFDRVFVKLETMTRLRDEDSKKYPRQSSVIITVTECKANSGGGNRTKLQRPEEKRRDATLVVIRSAGSSMLRDGTLRSALLAAVEKLSACKDERSRGDDEALQQQDRFHVRGSLFDVAVAFDWKTYFQHVFGQQPNSTHQTGEEDTRHGEWEGKKRARTAGASLHPEEHVDARTVCSYPISSPTPLMSLYTLLPPPPFFSYLHPSTRGMTYTGMPVAENGVGGLVFGGTMSSANQEASVGSQQEEVVAHDEIARQQLSLPGSTQHGASANRM